jgi:hypothetical protein
MNYYTLEKQLAKKESRIKIKVNLISPWPYVGSHGHNLLADACSTSFDLAGVVLKTSNCWVVLQVSSESTPTLIPWQKPQIHLNNF